MAASSASDRQSFFAALRGRWRGPRRRYWGVSGEKRELAPGDLARIRRQMHDCVEDRGGEVSARARAVDLGSSYLGLSSHGRREFLALLATEFDVDHAAATEAARRMARVDDLEEQIRAEQVLRVTLEPPRRRLLTQFNALPEGTRFLVDLRRDLLRFARRDERLLPLEQDLKALLTSWFDVGFLELRRITWDSPASLLEKLARSEAVHAVAGWDDLKNRLDVDRRFFAFFHPRMPDEPLVFVEVALVRGLPTKIGPLLDTGVPVIEPTEADTAIFYSISDAQRGLRGISYGGFLIKSVVDELSAELPRLKTFATLSPIPGFRPWLEQELVEDEGRVLLAEEQNALASAADIDNGESILGQLVDRQDWHESPDLADAMRGPLMRLCASYLLTEKRSDGRALDRVANFHLSNGARIERLNWLADDSPKGISASAGMMVNYLYKLSDIEQNHESYTAEQREIAASPQVTRLARDGKS